MFGGRSIPGASFARRWNDGQLLAQCSGGRGRAEVRGQGVRESRSLYPDSLAHCSGERWPHSGDGPRLVTGQHSMGVLQGAQCLCIHLGGGVLGARTGRHGGNFEGRLLWAARFPSWKRGLGTIIICFQCPTNSDLVVIRCFCCCCFCLFVSWEIQYGWEGNYGCKSVAAANTP